MIGKVLKLGAHRSGQFPNTDQQKNTDYEYISDPIRLIGTPLTANVVILTLTIA